MGLKNFQKFDNLQSMLSDSNRIKLEINHIKISLQIQKLEIKQHVSN